MRHQHRRGIPRRRPQESTKGSLRNVTKPNAGSGPRMTNPFCSTSLLNLPLTEGACQQIHAEALLRTSRESSVQSVVPSSVDGSLLRELRPRLGPAICLAHPREIEHL